MSRQFFRKAHLLDKPPKPPKPPPHPHLVRVRTARGGTVNYKSADVRMQQGRSKGGTTAQARGTAHRWTSETARKAVLKTWKTRWRKVKGVRVGRPARMRPPVKRAPLRAHYSEHPTKGIQFHLYHPESAEWTTGYWTITDDQGTRRLSERTALVHLGHLPNPHGLVPYAIEPTDPGTGSAGQATNDTTQR